MTVLKCQDTVVKDELVFPLSRKLHNPWDLFISLMLSVCKSNNKEKQGSQPYEV